MDSLLRAHDTSDSWPPPQLRVMFIRVCECVLDGSRALRRCTVDGFINARSLQLRGERGHVGGSGGVVG